MSEGLQLPTSIQQLPVPMEMHERAYPDGEEGFARHESTSSEVPTVAPLYDGVIGAEDATTGSRTLEEAVQEARDLYSKPLPAPSQAPIVAPCFGVRYDGGRVACQPVDLRDRQLASHVDYALELNGWVALQRLVERGRRFEVLLYTWRACSPAIPQIKDPNQENKMEIYRVTIEVLEQEIGKLHQLMAFQDEAIKLFSSEMKQLIELRKSNPQYFVSQSLLLAVVRVFNMFAILDELKNIKSSIKNDHSAFRRAKEMTRSMSNAPPTQDSQDLSMFLGTHNVILSALSKQLGTSAGLIDILISVIHFSLSSIEKERYIAPSDKHMLVKVIGFVLHLLIMSGVNIHRLEGKQKLSLSAIDRLFKMYEMLPLYGDMMISPFNYVKNSVFFDASKWSHCSSETRESQQARLNVDAMKAEHDKLMISFTLLCQKNSENQTRKIHDNDKNNNFNVSSESRQVYEFCLHALKALGGWTAQLMEMFSWKLAHPADPRIRNCPKEAEEYARATRYNYDSSELTAMIKTIAFIKSMQQLLCEHETELLAGIKRHVYQMLQELVQLTLKEPIRKAAKNKKKVLRNTLLTIHEIAANLQDGQSTISADLLQGKKDISAPVASSQQKAVSPSEVQLLLVNSMVESLVDKCGGKKPLRRELESDHVAALEAFLQSSIFWRELLDLQTTINRCADLSQFWYREFFLEMSRGSRAQFPVEMSMPWILTSHALNPNNQMLDYLLLTFDLYNDSADFALHSFCKKFLYDEIEAEASLCFSHLLFTLCGHVYSHFKQMAALLFLDRNFNDEGVRKKMATPIQDFRNLLSIHNFQLLGRQVDLCRLLSQDLSAEILKSLDVAISRFEASPLSAIVECEALIEVNRTCHKLLSELVDLPDFDELFHEANASVTGVYGRITLHAFYEISYDFLPHFCYNGTTMRFVRTPFELADVKMERDRMPNVDSKLVWGCKSLNRCFSEIYTQYVGFIDKRHLLSLCRLINYRDLAVVLRELAQMVHQILHVNLLPLLQHIREVMPRRIIIPKQEYGTEGAFVYYQNSLHDIMMYSDLQPKLFQSFREVGNAIILALLLSQSLAENESVELMLSDMFCLRIPKAYISKDGKSAEKVKAEKKTSLEKQLAVYKKYHVLPIVQELGSNEEKVLVEENQLLTQEKLCVGLSIFDKFLLKVTESLNSEAWLDFSTGIDNITETSEFHRLWSAFQFVFCMPARSRNEFSVEYLFGDGLQWAGCTIISLLKQCRKFQCYDFAYRLLDIHRKEDHKKTSDMVKGISMTKMTERIRRFQSLNSEIFSLVEKYSYGEPGKEPINIEHHEPPLLSLSNLADDDAACISSIYLDDFDDDDDVEMVSTA